MQTTKSFDHAILSSKALCIQFLREFGVSRDWARVNLAEMRTMLKRYPDEKMFGAAKTIVERDGDVYSQADFECEFAETIDAELDTAVETVEPKPVKPAAKPAVVQNDAPAVDEVAGLLARLLATGKQSVNPDEVRSIADQVFEGHAKSLLSTVSQATGKTLEYVQQVADALDAKVADAIKNVKPREIVVKTETTEVKIDGLQHFNFEKLLRVCSAKTSDGHRLNVWVHGPAGTGKTTAARNVAKALDLPFHCTGALLTKYDITGFIAAQGDLVRSPFREAWEHGGVFLFDEIDGSDPRAIVSFNSALANGVMAFPDKMVERHKDCVMIAAANTTGLGATAEFSGRMKMDAASIDRFVMLDWPIDESVESALCSRPEWAKVVQTVRRKVREAGVKNVAITPRATIYGCALLDTGLSMDDVKAMVLQKAMSNEQWNLVKA